MPNHVHLLLTLTECGSGGASPSPTITDMVGTLKSQTSRLSGMAPLWQRSYYDHVIRNEEDYRQIAEYIETNPAKWSDDEFYI